MCRSSPSVCGVSFGQCAELGRAQSLWPGCGSWSKSSTVSAIRCGHCAKAATRRVWSRPRFCYCWRSISRISYVALRMSHQLPPNPSLRTSPETQVISARWCGCRIIWLWSWRSHGHGLLARVESLWVRQTMIGQRWWKYLYPYRTRNNRSWGVLCGRLRPERGIEGMVGCFHKLRIAMGDESTTR